MNIYYNNYCKEKQADPYWACNLYSYEDRPLKHIACTGNKNDVSLWSLTMWMESKMVDKPRAMVVEYYRLIQGRTQNEKSDSSSTTDHSKTKS